MSSDRITRYVETQTRIAAKVEIGVLQPDPVHSGWTNFVSQKSVKAIAIAPKSQHIWLATWGGVLSWNRKEELLYRRYSSESGLAGNSISCLCVDRNENPWTGHAEGGLSYFNGRHWQVYSHLQTSPIRAIASAVNREGIWAATADTVYYIPHLECAPIPVAKQSDGAVEALALLADGDDLLLGNAFGLFRLGLNREPEAIGSDPLDNCTTLTRDGNGDVWVGTTNRLYQLVSEKSSQFFAREIIGSVGRIIGLAAGKKRVWILTAEGLAQVIDGQWMPVTGNSESEKPPFVQAIAASTDDAYLWLGTDRLLAGVRSTKPEDTRWDLDLLPLHRDDALNNLGRCIVSQNSNGRVWVGTAGGLVAFGAKNDWTICAKNNDVRSLIAISSGEDSTASESIWMLAWPQGIAQLIPPTRLNFPKLQLPGLPTLLSLGNDKSPYILTGRALWQLETGKLKEIAKAAPALPRCLLQTPDAVWWLGTVRGLYRLSADRWDFVGAQPGPLQAEIYALVVADNILWVASETGLWERRGDKWIAHNSEQTDASHAVWALAAGRSQTLWLASERGICRYDPKTRTYSATYTPFNSGLSSRRVAALLETSGFLWIVTQVGISRLTLDEGGKINEF